MVLGIDIETYSTVDLTRSTVYRYSEDPSFEVLLFGYAIDDGPVTVVDVTRDGIPQDIVTMLTSPDVVKQAYNANFERVCLSRALGMKDFLPPEQWRCTMVHALSCGLPRSLKDVGKVLGLSEEQAKMKEGEALIRYFCKPCRPTKANGGRTRNLPEHDPDKWATFIEYNRRDVETERTIRKIVEQKDLGGAEWRAYWLDQRINDRGVLCDRKLVKGAMQIAEEHAKGLTEEAVAISGLENPNSVAQVKSWLGVDGSLDKKAVRAMLQGDSLDIRQRRMLEIRQEAAKASISKYEAMERGMCSDNRVRGLFQFYGANRTGRWAGRQVQVQNLPQNHISDLQTARELAVDCDRESISALYGNVPDVLSQLIRTAFVAEHGKTLAVADFSAIEARVLAWLAGEKWRLDVFKSEGDIYCASASQMFHVPVEKHGVNGHLRQKGKIAELALGYGGSVGALKQMGALEMGLQEEELMPLVEMWRSTNQNVTRFWWEVDNAVKEAIASPGSLRILGCANGNAGIIFKCSPKLLNVRLPSGRCIRYWEPRIEINDMGREAITYGGTDAGKWGRLETYGPKLVENIVQATSRDCLRDAMWMVSRKFPDIVMHVHDEMIVEVDEAKAEEALEWMKNMMATCANVWAPGLPLRGDGYITSYYKKD